MRSRGLPLLLGFLVSACSSGGAPGSALPSERSPAGLAPAVAEALTWLPESSETLLVANGPFRLTSPYERGADRAPDAFYRQESICFADLLRVKAFQLAADVRRAAGGTALDGLIGLDFDFALEASERFRAPRNLGMMRYDGVLVAMASPSSRTALHELFAVIANEADERVERSGTTVAIRRPVVHGDAPDHPFVDPPRARFAAVPRPGLLLVANDEGTLETVLARLAAPPAGVAFPSDLPEWGRLDPRAACFALRHYRRDGFEDDPSSPLRGPAAANVPDGAAIGLIVEVRADSSLPAIARYLSTAPDPMQIARRAWTPSEGPKPRFALIAPGVVEVEQDVEKPLPASRFLFHALGLLGHGIYV